MRRIRTSKWTAMCAVAFCFTVAARPCFGVEPELTTEGLPPTGQLQNWFTPDRISSTLSTLLLVSAISLAPALILMTTCFVRITIVLGLIRQALGTPSLPPNQVLSALSIFLTGLIMYPVWTEVKEKSLHPYEQGVITGTDAFEAARVPVARFMANQIERTGNTDEVWLFLEYTGEDTSRIDSYDQVPFRALAPGFLLSELKTAFYIGFQIYLPFVVIDLVVSSIVTSLGLVTLPPTLVSMPFKLLMFVLVDGWHLTVGMLLESFA